MQKNGLRLVSVMCMIVGSPPVFAAEPVVTQCSVITDDRERLACYDQTYGRRLLPDAVAAPTATTSAAAARPVDEFGLSAATSSAREKEETGQSETDSVSVVVTAIGRGPTGSAVVTFDNGQIWEQVDASERLVLTAGTSVKIRRAALGSYKLVTPSRGAVRVRRVK